MFRHFYNLSVLTLLVFVLFSCRQSSYLAEDYPILHKEKVYTADKSVDIKFLQAYLNNNNAISVQGKRKKAHLRFDSTLIDKKCEALKNAMQSEGFLKAQVDYEASVKGKKVDVRYIVDPSKPYFVHNISYHILDPTIDTLVNIHAEKHRGIAAGSKFSVELLEQERRNITSFLRDNGYFRFNKDFVRFIADTLAGSQLIDLSLIVDRYVNSVDNSPMSHPCYRIGDVTYTYVGDGVGRLRRKVVESNMVLQQGDKFSARQLSQTYNNFARLHAVKYTNIKFRERADTTVLDQYVELSTNKLNTISFQPEGTNTAGNLGAAASLTYENRNLFRGSETFSLQLRGAFEAITQLEGYQNHDYKEYSVEARLNFPRLIVPFLSLKSRLHSTATSELAINFNFQNRPEFHRRVFAAAWRYRWKSATSKYAYKVDFLDLNFISMPWIAATFKQNYLDNTHSRNAILRYNYEDIFIMKTGFGFTKNSRRQTLRLNVETSGNLLDLVSHIVDAKTNANQQYTIFNNAFAQYAKSDVDYSYSLPTSKKSQLVFHVAFGVAYPYGNSRVLPFEKRYFGGGANSVRGWNVRGLGPGHYRSRDGAIDFINQTGDMKLDMNIEYRMPFFWKLTWAAFIDAGNIWTLRSYEEQAGGQFRLTDVLRQMAVAYGVGLRLNFDYFILRFDMGMKAINPSYQTSKEHFPFIHPKFGRDNAFHFAVGLPF